MYKNYEVLFVDDEVNILNSLRRGLMDEEYVCHFATSGKDALEIMERKRIAVIVSDMRMPEMDGLTLLKEVNNKWPKIIKIVLSGYTQLQQILVTINQVDIFKYILKPWKLEDDVKGTIRKALDYYILKEENEKYKQELEIKNKLYLKMLQRVDDVIEDAKRASEKLGLLGKVILEFGTKFDNTEREKYKSIFRTQDKLFELFSKAIISEMKEYSSDNLIEQLLVTVINQFNEVKISKLGTAVMPIKVYLEMLEVVISTCIITFYDEFKASGLAVNIGIDQNNKFGIYLLALYDESIEEDQQKSGNSILDIKIDFIKTLLETIIHDYYLNFVVSKENGRLVLAIIAEKDAK